jgi:PIN domain nuclease of toxin-antitoxin system
MTILLDTQVWLWMLIDPKRLSWTAASKLRSRSNDLLLSSASAWEISEKCVAGKLKLPGDLGAYITDRMRRTNVEPLQVTHRHALRAGTLPDTLDDPFDRLIIAQAIVEGVPVITADPRFATYGVEVFSAT